MPVSGTIGFKNEYNIIITPNLAGESGRESEEKCFMKIKVKKVQVLDFTFDVRLTPPPPKVPRGFRPRPGATCGHLHFFSKC